MIKYILLILICLFLTGCFEILEEVSLKEDGSGNFKITLNLSQSKTKLKSIMLMEKVNGHRMPSKEEVKTEIIKAKNIAKTIEGISEVEEKIDFDNFIFSLSCNFKNINDINTLVYKLRESKEKIKTPFEKHYEYSKSEQEFKRNFTFLWGNEFNKLQQSDKDIFEGANYIAIYRFNKEVSSVLNKEAKVSSNKKNVMLKLKATDVINKKSTIKNQLKLK